jgi:trigger factor
MWNHTARRLQAQGIDPAQYLQMTGKTEEELVHEAEPEAERALKRESVLAAVVEQEGIEASDDEVLGALREAAATEPGAKEPSERKLRKAYDRMRADGRDEMLREDIAMRKAVDLLVEHAKPIAAEQAEAREKLWTPEKEGAQKAGELWTPEGSKG